MPKFEEGDVVLVCSREVPKHIFGQSHLALATITGIREGSDIKYKTKLHGYSYRKPSEYHGFYEVEIYGIFIPPSKAWKGLIDA